MLIGERGVACDAAWFRWWEVAWSLQRCTTGNFVIFYRFFFLKYVDCKLIERIPSPFIHLFLGYSCLLLVCLQCTANFENAFYAMIYVFFSFLSIFLGKYLFHYILTCSISLIQLFLRWYNFVYPNFKISRYYSARNVTFKRISFAKCSIILRLWEFYQLVYIMLRITNM